MKLDSLGFLLEEAGRNIRRNGLQSLAALSTVTVALAVLGGALFTLHRLHQFVDAQPKQFEIQVFMKADELAEQPGEASQDASHTRVTHHRRRRHRQETAQAPTIASTANSAADRQTTLAVQRRIRTLPGVSSVSLYSREQALADWQLADSKKGTSIAAALPGNPFPDRLDVHVKDPQETSAVAGALQNVKRFPEVAKVLDDRQTVNGLVRISRWVSNASVLAAVALCLATALVIQNTIRLTVFARRREIRIMQLVGATAGFIKLPMILEGVFYGVAGAALATTAVLFALHKLSDYASKVQSPLMSQPLPPPMSATAVFCVLVAVGAAVGWSGSTLSVRRHLLRI